MINQIPLPTIERVCAMYNLLIELGQSGTRNMSSGELGEFLGFSATSIRKDISLIGDPGNSGAKYDVVKLRQHLENKLGIGKRRKACVVGIGRMGSAILDYGLFREYGFEIAAGFDSNVNIVETKKTNVKLYPAYHINDVVKSDNIELAFLCVPVKAAQNAADRLIEAGIKGILNLTNSQIKCDKKEIYIAKIDVMKEMRTLSALISLSIADNNFDQNTRRQDHGTSL